MTKKPKKIAIVYSGAKHKGGVETYLELLFANADKSKADLTLISLGEWPLTAKLQAANCQLQIFSGSRINPIAVLQIAKFLRKNKFNLVVSQGTVANFYARLASMYSDVTSLVVVHSDPYYDYPNALLRAVYVFADRLTRFPTRRYIAVSEYLKKKLVSSGVADDKITVIMNGVCLKGSDPGQGPTLPKKDILDPWPTRACRTGRQAKDDNILTIGSIGRLHKVKNYSELIHAFAQLPATNYQLRIIGEGSERKNLEGLITKLNLSGEVELLGNVENVHELFSSWDIYIQPSLSEGFGLTVVEAMLAGKPVIVSPRGSLPELVENHVTGIVMEGTAREDISAALHELILDTEKADEIASNGQKYALKEYAVETWIKKTEKALLEVIK
jgi:glycosyltransferase involved in cell wall biosynthesis